jgi:sulfatase modifying factor 1
MPGSVVRPINKLKMYLPILITISFLLETIPASSQQQHFTNSIGIEFVLIKPGHMIVGKFQPPYPVPEDTIKDATRPMNMWMGEGHSYNETEFELAKKLATEATRPGFEVRVDHAYYIGKFEVTQQEWRKVMGVNPSIFQSDTLPERDRHPVDNISWGDTQQFLSRLNEMDPSHSYRLPTEFEWEYAARAGSEDDIPWPETERGAQLGGVCTQAVGQKKPNGWGLYDMLGNVWEWVEDFYNEAIFADPIPPPTGTLHVLKGASFAGDVKNATWFTHAAGPANGWDVGFRVVMDVTDKK